MNISQITRRDLVDAISVEKINWSGRLEEPEFLSRLFNLASLPSTDGRFKDAANSVQTTGVTSFGNIELTASIGTTIGFSTIHVSI
jgi:AbiJ-like protein